MKIKIYLKIKKEKKRGAGGAGKLYKKSLIDSIKARSLVD
jgi:hypothetical protein